MALKLNVKYTVSYLDLPGCNRIMKYFFGYQYMLSEPFDNFWQWSLHFISFIDIKCCDGVKTVKKTIIVVSCHYEDPYLLSWAKVDESRVQRLLILFFSDVCATLEMPAFFFMLRCSILVPINKDSVSLRFSLIYWVNLRFTRETFSVLPKRLPSEF